MIDLHCHILPGVDYDGPRSVDESAEMLRIAASEGIRAIAATHHFNAEENTPESYLSDLQNGLERLQPALVELELDIHILSGAEVYISPVLLSTDGLDKLCINKSRYLLIELPMLDIPQYTEEVIYSLRLKDMVPIIAHPERNRRIAKNPELLSSLIKLGALSQVNTGSITGLIGREAQRCAKYLFSENLAHFVSSDAHNTRKRVPHIKNAAKLLSRWVGKAAAERILYDNPDAVVKDVFIE
ncbi:MAG TPA: hypothetical protein PK830_08145 [Candidatus Atribacteria bacterium]|nr:hypothetical protein [Candidatus Atribacteria bacterium]